MGRVWDSATRSLSRPWCVFYAENPHFTSYLMISMEKREKPALEQKSSNYTIWESLTMCENIIL